MLGWISWAPRAGTVLAALMTGALAQVPPTDVPGVTLTAESSLTRDGNLFRLPDGASPRQFGLNADARGDTLIVPSLSADAAMQYSRQRFQLSGSLSRELLRENPGFDTTDLKYRGSWKWQVGNDWSGELADSQQQQRTSFADQLLTRPNRQTTHSKHASADYHPRPDRRLGVSFDEYVGSNSLGVRQIYDYRITISRAEVGLDSGLGSELVIGASTTHADYPNQQIFFLAPVDNSYRELQLDLSSLLVLTEKTQLRWRIGYAKRRHPDVSQRDFSGPVGNLGLDWRPTAKIQGRITVARDLNEVSDFDRIYTVTTMASGELSYAPTFKTQLAVTANAQRVDYRGDPRNFFTAVFGRGKYREDRYDAVKTSFTWAPTDHLTIQLSEALGTRNSNQPHLQYRDWTTGLDLKYWIGPWP